MQDIQLIGNKLIFYRKVWSADDIFLAQCLWFEESIEDSTFTADLTVTLPTAVKAFLEHAYPAFMGQPVHAAAKEQLSKDVAKVYKQLRKKYEAEVAPRIPYWSKLRKHQKKILFEIYFRHVNLLGMQQRTGKTITAASHSLAIGAKRTVVLCRTIGKFNWLKDLTSSKWNALQEVFNEFDFTILDAQKRKCMYAWRERFVIVNYESAGKYLPYLIESGGVKTDHIVIDECQDIKNMDAARSKVVQELIAACPEARLTPMSGTYIMNRVDDAFNYLRLARHPLGKSKADFDRRYLVRETKGKHTKTTGAKDTDKLAAHMSNFAIRVLFADCSDMPKKQHIELHFPIDEWRDKYVEAVRKSIEDYGKRVGNSWIHSVNNVMAQAKVPGTIELIKQTVSEGNKIVIFTSYTEPLDMLERAMKENKIRYERVDGKVLDAAEKMRRATEFQENPEVMVFLGNMKAAGHTIPLHVANIMVQLNHPLTPKESEQCTSRLEAVEKTDAVTIYYPTAIGEKDEVTVDEKMMELNGGKNFDIDAVVDGGKDINNIQNTSEVLFESMISQYGKKEKV